MAVTAAHKEAVLVIRTLTRQVTGRTAHEADCELELAAATSCTAAAAG